MAREAQSGAATTADRSARIGQARPMRIVEGSSELMRVTRAWRRQGLTVGFVPTMGALHDGHLSLIHRARERTSRVVASVFVNPTQFGPHEDLASYPRDSEGDAQLLAASGCDLLFLPGADEIYPDGSSTWVSVDGPPAEGLEADHRPGHFRGVATVVSRLFNRVRPDVAVFGEKDAQQLAVVRRLARDLHPDVTIEAAPTLREPDGLAMSSRNAYLSPDERRRATVLYRALAAARSAIEDGERNAECLRRGMTEILSSERGVAVDYAEVVDADTFLPVDRISGRIVLPVAARLGKTRLIDNVSLKVGA